MCVALLARRYTPLRCTDARHWECRLELEWGLRRGEVLAVLVVVVVRGIGMRRS